MLRYPQADKAVVADKAAGGSSGRFRCTLHVDIRSCTKCVFESHIMLTWAWLVEPGEHPETAISPVDPEDKCLAAISLDLELSIVQYYMPDRMPR